MEASQIVLFLGSGASKPGPSDLPTFRDMREAWLNVISKVITRVVDIDRQKALKNRIEETPPEALLQIIDQVSRKSLIQALTRTLDEDVSPNSIHEAAARLIFNGGTVWTTNFDLLIEKAAGLEPTDPIIAYDQSTPESFVIPAVRLLKPHGSLSSPNTLMFRSRDVLRPISELVCRRLINDIQSNHFAFLGYSASDLDLRPIFRDHLRECKSVVWFCFEGEVSRLREQLGLDSNSKIIEFRSSDSPSQAFLQWLNENELYASSEPFPADKSTDIPYLTNLLDEPLILARLFQRLRVFDISRVLLRKEIVRKPKTIFTLLNMLRYERHPLGILATIIWRGIQSLSFERSTREYALYSLSYLAFEGGSYRLGAWIAKAGPSKPSFERRIQYSACLRMLSQFENALNELALVEKQPDLCPDSNQEARLLFEKAESLRWSGREQETIDLIMATDFNRINHADPTWLGWVYFELATCLSLRYPEVRLDKAYDYTQKAQDIFAPVFFSQPLGTLNTHLLFSSLNRIAGNFDQATKQLELFRQKEKGSGRQAFLVSAAAFEEGELSRYNGQYETASQQYSMVVRSSSLLQQAHGHLGLAEPIEIMEPYRMDYWRLKKHSDSISELDASGESANRY